MVEEEEVGTQGIESQFGYFMYVCRPILECELTGPYTFSETPRAWRTDSLSYCRGRAQQLG
jgi:hypothetical protein